MTGKVGMDKTVEESPPLPTTSAVLPERRANFGHGRRVLLGALGVSVLLHGALAATALNWWTAPVPEPTIAIAVELVSVSPDPGQTTIL